MHWLIYFLVGLMALLILMQFTARLRAKRTQGQPAPDTTAVDGAAHVDRRRVYYFFATHCGPCRVMTPTVDHLRTTHRNLVKVNVAESPELARGFRIAATPSFVLVEDGVIRQVRLGTQSDRQLLAMLEIKQPQSTEARSGT
jgi:thioredoxin 1